MEWGVVAMMDMDARRLNEYDRRADGSDRGRINKRLKRGDDGKQDLSSVSFPELCP